MTPDFGSEMSWNKHKDVGLGNYFMVASLRSMSFMCDKCRKAWTPWEMKEAQMESSKRLFCCPDCERKDLK